MPTPSLPATLSSSKWKALAKDLDKGLGIASALADLEGAHQALAGGINFAMAMPDKAAAAQKALADLAAAEKKLVPAAAAKARAASTLAKTKDGELAKKDPKAAKLLGAALGKIVTDALAYAKDVEKQAADLRVTLDKLATKLAADEKKAAADDEGDDDSGDSKVFLVKTLSAFKDVKKYEPVKGKPSPFRFVAAWNSAKAAIFAGKSASYGEKHRQMLFEMLGVPKAEHTLGELTWDAERNAYVFSCRGKIPAPKKVKQGLKEQLGRTVNVLVRKLVKGKGGEDEFEDVADDADDADDDAGAPTVTATDPVQEFSSALKAKSARIVAAIGAGGPAAEAIRKLLGEANALGKTAAGVPKAKTLLAQIDALIARVGTAASAPSAAPAAGLDRLRKARNDWVKLYGDFTKEVHSLVAWLDDIYREEPEQKAAVAKAKKDLVTAAARVTPTLASQLDAMLGEADPKSRSSKQAAAKKALETVKAAVFTDKILLAIDKNEQNPSLTIVSSMQASLREVEAALG